MHIAYFTLRAGYIYQHFITAVIFVAFTNPYNIGDRVRVDGGDILYVRRIRTYTTEFESMHGKPVSTGVHEASATCYAILFDRVLICCKF